MARGGVSGMFVEVLTDIDDLPKLAADWWALFARSPRATPFQSPAWAIAWWQTFAPGSLRAIAVWDGTSLVGLAPLYLEAGGDRLVPVGLGISDHLDVLMDPACEPAVARCLVLAIEALPGWTALSLEDLAPGAAALALSFPDVWRERRAPHDACPVLALPDTGEALDRVIPAGKLRKLRMARHRGARRGGVVEAARAEDATQHLDHLVRLHAIRWESRGEAGVLADPRVEAFHRAALPGLVRHDLLRSYILRLDGTVAGVFYGLRCRNTTYAYLGGFDPAFGFESPGSLLLGHAIEQAVNEGCTLFSLLRGQERYKYEWGAVDRWNTRRELRRDAQCL